MNYSKLMQIDFYYSVGDNQKIFFRHKNNNDNNKKRNNPHLQTEVIK